jgi:lysophospholipase L1-like esterase
MNTCHAARAARVIALSLVLALLPSATAFAASITQIGDPVTDTVQLWTTFAALFENVAHQLVTELDHRQPPTVASSKIDAQAASAALATEQQLPTVEVANNTSATEPALEQSSIGTTTVVYRYIAQPAIASLVQAPSTSGGYVTESEFAAGLSALNGSLHQLIANNSFEASAAPPLGGGAPNTIAAASAIDQLSGVTITNANLTASEIPTDIVASNYLPLSGGTLTGTLNVQTINASSTILSGFSTTNATTTNLFAQTASIGSLSLSSPLSVANGGTGWASIGSGYVPFGNGASALATSSKLYWDNADGRLGIGTSSPTAILTLDSSSPNGTIMRVSNSSPGGHIYDWLSTGSGNSGGAGRLDLYDFTVGAPRLSIASNGNVGVGTTSPSANFAVAGNAFLSGNLSVGDAVTTRSNLGLPYATASSFTTIATWGDSLTYGAGGISYPSQLSNLAGVPIYNGGVNGYTSSQIAAAMLAASSTWSDPTIIWAGTNDITGSLSTDEPIIDSNIASMVAALQSVGNNNYLILSIMNYTTEPVGNATHNEIIQINSDLASLYGAHYWDVRSYLVSKYNPSLPQDVIDHGNDVLPTSLRFDTLHPNTAGNLDIAQYLYQHISLLIPTSTTALITTQNLTNLLQNSFSFSYIDTTSGYKQGGNVVLAFSEDSVAVGSPNAASWMAATSTAFDDVALGYNALGATPTNSAGLHNTALGALTLSSVTTGGYNTASGYQALYSNTTGLLDTAMGVQALNFNTTGNDNVAVGVSTLYKNTTGSSNISVGDNSLSSNTTGSFNVGVGYQSLLNATSTSDNTAVGQQAMSGSTVGSLTISGTNNVALGFQALTKYIDGSSNIAIGYQAMVWATTTKNSVAIGYSAGSGASTNDNYQGLVALGYQSGKSLANGSDYNTFLGYQSGYGVTTGSNNIWIGTATSSTGIANLTTGSQNILIGNNISLPSAINSGQLDIGNTLFGTGVTGTGSTIAGNIGIGTSNPYSRLEVWGPDTASTTAFSVANNASTTEFAVYDTGNAVLAGGLTQNSDQRLKTNIQSLTASSSLSLIDQLNPVIFNWIDPNKGTTPQLGFIAQQVLPIFPNLVSTTSATALTPDGTLSLNYIDLISPIVSAIQALSDDITSIENTIAGFATNFTTGDLTYDRATGNITSTQTLCLTDGPNDQSPICITKVQLAAVLASENQSSADSSSASSNVNVGSTTPDTPPVIQINGDNPAIVQVGATYNDLGATITGPQADLNLGITTFLNGTLTSNIVIDTSAAATDTIDYVATDQNGLTSTSTRTVVVQAPVASNPPVPNASSTVPTSSLSAQ